MFISFRFVGALIAAASFCLPSVHAQTWPARPITIVVPFAPGGSTDSATRISAAWLTKRLGMNVIVANRPGASGAVAADSVAQAPADGYTLFMASVAQLSIMPLITKINYVPERDFAPITKVASNVFAIALSESFPAKTLQEFVAHVKTQPGKLSYASSGSGSVGHLAMALFLSRAGLDMVHVPYKGGAPALNDVLAGHIPVVFTNVPEIIPHFQGGKIRVLAVSGPNRIAQLPNVPTVAESGYPGFEIATWVGLVAPAKTPESIVNRVASEMALATKDAEFVKRMDVLGLQVIGSSPTEFAAMLRADAALWAQAVKSSGITIQ